MLLLLQLLLSLLLGFPPTINHVLEIVRGDTRGSVGGCVGEVEGGSRSLLFLADHSFVSTRPLQILQTCSADPPRAQSCIAFVVRALLRVSAARSQKVSSGPVLPLAELDTPRLSRSSSATSFVARLA